MYSVKFYITPVYPFCNDHYYQEIVALAEGFRELGYPITGNFDYWFEPEKNEFLIKGDINSQADIEIYDYRYIEAFGHVLFRRNGEGFNDNCINILVDRNDWISPDWMKSDLFSVFDIIFSGNLFVNIDYKQNVFPSAMGITKRQMNYIDNTYENIETEKIIGYNFRVPHNLRRQILDNMKKMQSEIFYPLKSRFTNFNSDSNNLSEIDKYYWKKTTKRHNPEYFEIINQCLLFLAVGGFTEYKPLSFRPHSLIDKIKRLPYRLLNNYLQRRNKDVSKTVFVFQHDSFRLWETLYARTVPILLDFEYWNFDLPVMPQDGEHYIGIEELDLKAFARKLESYGKEELIEIGKNGRDFVIENYSPSATAKRLLSYIETLGQNK